MPLRSQPGYDTEQIEGDLAVARGAVDALNEYAELTTAVVAGTVVAANPANTNSLNGTGAPMTQETPHTLTPGGGWSGTLRYWMNPHGASGVPTMHISVENMTAGNPANGSSGVTIATLPLGYRPATLQGFAVSCAASNSGVGPGFYISNAGVIQSQGVGAASTSVYGQADIPLS
jgi:hypothetical protein